MTEYTDDEWDEICEERMIKRYRAHLAAHPHPADPDHPDPEDYGIFEDDDNE